MAIMAESCLSPSALSSKPSSILAVGAVALGKTEG
jgi:hypothetical protein